MSTTPPAPIASHRVYYLEEPLSEDDLRFVAQELASGGSLEQVRVPHVLPVRTGGWTEKEYEKHQRMLRKHLITAGISRDQGWQVILVAPRDMYWYATLAGAVEAETGQYPWLVQTEAQREAIGNPGSTRILDMEGLFGRKLE